MSDDIFERTLIIGGTGFIGSSLATEISQNGYQPLVLSREKHNQQLTFKEKRKINSVVLDVSDLKTTADFIVGYRPTLILNCAAVLNDLTKQKSQLTEREISKNILVSALEARVKRIILFGSADEYGYQPIPQNENFELKPNSVYARSKAEVTQLAEQMYGENALPVVVLRPFTVYGSEQPRKMFLSQAIRCALEGKVFEMSEGKQKRDYLYISDLVSAVMKAIQTPGIEGEVFNIGSGNASPLREIAEKVWEICGADPNLLKIGGRNAALAELHDTCADISKAKQIIKWEPVVSLEKGLEKTIKSIIETL